MYLIKALCNLNIDYFGRGVRRWGRATKYLLFISWVRLDHNQGSADLTVCKSEVKWFLIINTHFADSKRLFRYAFIGGESTFSRLQQG